jgi:hypothetical protein
MPNRRNFSFVIHQAAHASQAKEALGLCSEDYHVIRKKVIAEQINQRISVPMPYRI